MDAAYWEELCPGGLRFLYGNGQFPPGLDSFVLSSMPRLKPGLRVCDLGCGTGFLSILLLQRQREQRRGPERARGREPGRRQELPRGRQQERRPQAREPQGLRGQRRRSSQRRRCRPCR